MSLPGAWGLCQHVLVLLMVIEAVQGRRVQPWRSFKQHTQLRHLQQASKCPGDCTKYGVCNEELGECQCPRHRKGAACEQEVADVRDTCTKWGFSSLDLCMSSSVARCMNHCHGRGKCMGGFCHCQPGYYGVDCALSLDAAGTPELLAGLGYTVRPQGPRVYVYELPGNFNFHWNLLRLDRPLHLLLWQRLLGAGVRVADPKQADYFFIPVKLRHVSDGHDLLQAIEYIRTRWPYWDQLKGQRHFVLHTGDMGRIELVPEAQRTAENVTFLTHWGLTQDQPGGNWKPSHRPGLDIVVPVFVQPSLVEGYGMHTTPMHPEHPQHQAPRHQSGIKLFFAGRICGNRRQPTPGVWPNCDNTTSGNGQNAGYSAGTRQKIFYHHGNRTGFKIVTHSSTYAQDMSTAQFCLAPTGGGHGKRNVLVSMLGCVPVTVTDHVMQPFQPELDWSAFSVHVPESDIPRLHEVLDQVSHTQYDTLRAALKCGAQHLFWSTIYGSIMGEDGRFDAFETLMAILAARLRHPGVPADQLAAADTQLAAFMRCEGGTPAVDRETGLRLLCTKNPDDKGALPCKDSVNPMLIPGGAMCNKAANLAQCPRWA